MKIETVVASGEGIGNWQRVKETPQEMEMFYIAIGGWVIIHGYDQLSKPWAMIIHFIYVSFSWNSCNNIVITTIIKWESKWR